jgi:DNA excision repair protein ERCC-8
MNQLLFDRSTGSLKPNAFARLKSTQLIYDIQLAPNLRFDGDESSTDESAPLEVEANIGDGKLNICAHQAGINALVVDRFDGRL